MSNYPVNFIGFYPLTRAEAVNVADILTLADMFPLYGKRLGCYGDSITISTVPDQIKPYPRLVAERWAMEITNCGVSNTTVLSNTPIDGVTDADYVTFASGINDYQYGTPLGTMEDDAIRGETFYGSLKYIAKSLITRYHGAKVALITPLKIATDSLPTPETPNSAGHTLPEYVQAINNVGARYSIPVLDLYSTSGIFPESAMHMRCYMLADGIHPNQAGHEHLARIYEKFLMML